jgi:hypothetical protein
MKERKRGRVGGGTRLVLLTWDQPSKAQHPPPSSQPQTKVGKAGDLGITGPGRVEITESPAPTAIPACRDDTA